MRAQAIGAELQRAVLLIKTGQLGPAESVLLKLRAESPGIVPTHVYLGLIADARGQAAAAIQHFEQALRLDPKDADIRLRLAKLCLHSGQTRRAVDLLESLSLAKPTPAGTWRMLGEALHLEKRLKEAVEVLQRAARESPGDIETLCSLGKVLHEAEQPAAAQEVFDQLKVSSPAHDKIYLAEAQALIEASDVKNAVRVYREGELQCPGSADLQIALGQALEDMGDATGAQVAYRRALELKPGKAQALGKLLSLAGAKAEQKWIEDAHKVIENPQSSDIAVAAVGYGLGRALHAAGDSQRAFSAWVRANEARRREAGAFVRGNFTQRIDVTMARFTRSFFAERADWGMADEAPVFIVGMPRSGTTLTEQILSSHPEVEGLGELPDIPIIASQLGRAVSGAVGWPQAAPRLTADQVRKSAQAHLSALKRRAKPSTLCIVDKAPLNYVHLGLIALLFPRARIIWCERDPRDVCLSIFTENFALQQTHATDLGDLGCYYREYRRLMQHWLEVLPLPLHRVQYEQLVQSPEEQARALCKHLGLEWHPDCLQFHERGSAVLTPSRWQVRQPIYSTSVGRWRVYEQWLGPLISALGPEIAAPAVEDH